MQPAALVERNTELGAWGRSHCFYSKKKQAYFLSGERYYLIFQGCLLKRDPDKTRPLGSFNFGTPGKNVERCSRHQSGLLLPTLGSRIKTRTSSLNSWFTKLYIALSLKTKPFNKLTSFCLKCSLLSSFLERGHIFQSYLHTEYFLLSVI